MISLDHGLGLGWNIIGLVNKGWEGDWEKVDSVYLQKIEILPGPIRVTHVITRLMVCPVNYLSYPEFTFSYIRDGKIEGPSLY